MAKIDTTGGATWSMRVFLPDLAVLNPYLRINEKIAKGEPGDWRPVWDYKIWLGTHAFDGMEGRECWVKNGWLYLTLKYRWNGSNVVPDRPESLLASAIHDALCEMIAKAGLGIWQFYRLRRLADKIYRKVCKAQRLWGFLPGLRFAGLRMAAPWQAIKNRVFGK